MFTIEIKRTGIAALSKSQVNRAQSRANFLTGVHFRENMIAARFTVAGGRRLKYTPRSGEYALGKPRMDKAARRYYAPRKWRALGHSDPFVFSGAARREATTNPHKVRSTRAYFKIPFPRKLNRSNPKSKIRMADEVRRVTGRELGRLEKELVGNSETQLALVAGSSRFRRVSASITGA